MRVLVSGVFVDVDKAEAIYWEETRRELWIWFRVPADGLTIGGGLETYINPDVVIQGPNAVHVLGYLMHETVSLDVNSLDSINRTLGGG